jgi:hypothetical protein
VRPTIKAKRLKVGTSDDLLGRLEGFRCVCPDAHVIGVAPGNRFLESRVLAEFERQFKHVRGEVFEVDPFIALAHFETVARDAP